MQIHAFILTFNEEQHISRCIESIRALCDSITVVDSGSGDRTVEIASSLGVEVIFNEWTNHAAQVNFAIRHMAARSGWFFRIDADEILTPGGVEHLRHAASESGDEVGGLLLRRQIHFLGKRIRHGGLEPSWQLRMWRSGRGQCEQRWMDEHVTVQGEVRKSGAIIADINKNNLTWWISKHNDYASREAIEVLLVRHKLVPREALGSGASPQARRRRWLKETLYRVIPRGLRPHLYFWYRYVFRFGFMDGSQGYYFHILQCFWYRTLVDAKLSEITRLSATRGLSVPDAILHATGIRVLD